MNNPLVKIMQDVSIRKALGKRIKQLRKDKGCTQKELANLSGISHAQLNKYESGLNTPPLNRLMTLAEVFNTTLDYMIGGQHTGDLPIHNIRLIQRFQSIEEFESEEREVVIKVLDAMIAKHKMESTLKSMKG